MATGSKRPAIDPGQRQSRPDKPNELPVRKATWLITAHPDKIDENNALKLKLKLKLKQLRSRCPELGVVTDCVQAFVGGSR
ncbi:hypothetical protein [Streptomyces sp. NPDC054783]